MNQQKHDSTRASKSFFDIAHVDITCSNITAPGAMMYTLIIVDRKTRFTYYTLPLKDCKGNSIIFVLKNSKQQQVNCLDSSSLTSIENVNVKLSQNSVQITVGRVGGQSFLYCGLHSDYVSERSLTKSTIKFSSINYSNLFYCEKDENISHLFL